MSDHAPLPAEMHIALYVGHDRFAVNLATSVLGLNFCDIKMTTTSPRAFKARMRAAA